MFRDFVSREQYELPDDGTETDERGSCDVLHELSETRIAVTGPTGRWIVLLKGNRILAGPG